MTSKIMRLTDLGQSIWYDYMGRRLLDNGELAETDPSGRCQGFNVKSKYIQSSDCKIKRL